MENLQLSQAIDRVAERAVEALEWIGREFERYNHQQEGVSTGEHRR